MGRYIYVEIKICIPKSRVVILVRAAAEVSRRLHGVARRDPAARLSVQQVVARRHVHATANGLRRIHGVLPFRKGAACGSAGGSARGRGTGGRRGCTGAVVRVCLRFGGVEVGRE